MRDTVQLNAVIYRPLGGTPQTAVLIETPYVADTYRERGRSFAQHGFAVPSPCVATTEI
jgi:predicted acyl esterase